MGPRGIVLQGPDAQTRHTYSRIHHTVGCSRDKYNRAERIITNRLDIFK